MSKRDAVESWPQDAARSGVRLGAHLAELYVVQPLPDEFVRLALAIGESCGRAREVAPSRPRYALRRAGRRAG